MESAYRILITAVIVVLGVVIWRALSKKKQNEQSRKEANLKASLNTKTPSSLSLKSLEWSDEFEIDNGTIDKDHKHLIVLINKFIENIPKFRKPKDMAPYLLSLKKYTQIHFEREEQLQRNSAFLFYADHKKEHADLTKELEQIIQKALAANDNKVQEVATEIALFLQDQWIVTHIIESDLPMKAYVSHMREKA